MCSGCEYGYYDSLRRNDEDIVDFLFKHNVIAGSRICPSCKNLAKLEKQDDNYVIECISESTGKRKKQCHFRKTLFEDAFFDLGKFDLGTFFSFIAHTLYFNPPRKLFLVREFRLKNSVVMNWLDYCRDVFVFDSEKHCSKLGGFGTVVEIDEGKIGKVKNKDGKGIDQHILGIVQRNCTDLILVPMAECNADILLKIVEDRVFPGTTVVSPCWKNYSCFSHEGFHKLMSKNCLHLVNLEFETSAHTNHVKRAWRDVKGSLPKCGVSERNYKGYLAEFLFKRRYKTPEERMHHFFTAVAQMRTLSTLL